MYDLDRFFRLANRAYIYLCQIWPHQHLLEKDDLTNECWFCFSRYHSTCSDYTLVMYFKRAMITALMKMKTGKWWKNRIIITSLDNDFDNDENKKLGRDENIPETLNVMDFLSHIPKEKDRDKLLMLCAGYTYKEIADKYGLWKSAIPYTVKKYQEQLRVAI